MDDGSPIFSIIVIIVCLIVNIILNGYQEAIDTVADSALDEEKENHQKTISKIEEWQENPVKLIGTVRAATMLTTILIIIFAYVSLGRFLLERFSLSGLSFTWAVVLSYLITIIISLVLNLSVGVYIPQKIASYHSKSWAINLTGAVSAFMVGFTPITASSKAIARLILLLFKIDIDKDYDEVTEEEIMSMVNEGHELGVIEASEAEMITNIFEYGDKEAVDIMTHRKNIIAVDGELPLKEVINKLLEESVSRVPVYVGDIDNIIGILHIRDLMLAANEASNMDKALKDINDILNKAHFIPETRKLDDLFKRMQQAKTHMVIVVDEYGQTAGLVTMEDILEEIVGNILDEHDEDITNIQYVDDDTYHVSGLTTIDELEESLGIEIDDDEHDTVNGFITAKLGRIPEEDERSTINVNGCEFKILAVENKIISLLEVKLPKEVVVEEEDR